MIQKFHLKDITKTAYVPKDLQHRVGILPTFESFESASPQWVTMQLFDRIYLKVDSPEEEERQTGMKLQPIIERMDTILEH